MLLKSFKLLFDDLTNIAAKSFLTTEKIVTFASDEIFQRASPEGHIFNAQLAQIDGDEMQ